MSGKKYNRFLEHSLGSAFELETQLLIADFVDYGNEMMRPKRIQDVLEEQRMLMSFTSKLNK